MRTRIILQRLVVLIGVLLMSACASTTGHSRVKMVDSNERGHFNATLNMTDLMAAADKLTNKLLMDNLVNDWVDKKPRLIIGRIVNRTDIDNNFPEEELYDRIAEIILSSGMARIVGKSSDEFEYILTGRLNSTTETSGDQMLRQYRITLWVHNAEDELLGAWHEPISLMQSSKPLF